MVKRQIVEWEVPGSDPAGDDFSTNNWNFILYRLDLVFHITSLHQQADVYKQYLINISKTTALDYIRIPFNKAYRDKFRLAV